MRSVCLLMIFVVSVLADHHPMPKILTTVTTSTISSVIRQAKLPEVQINATWECGTDEFTKSLSEGEILAKCPKLRDHINSCCYQHDNCYDAQSGQKFCDDSFCSCLERRSRSSKQCHDESGPMFCELVRTFGDDAYKASAPGATTPDEGLVEKDDYDYESHVKNATEH